MGADGGFGDTAATPQARTVPRRAFVLGVGGLLVGGAVASSGLGQLVGAAPAAAPPVLGRHAFEQCLGEKFTLAETSLSSLQLVKVRPLRHAPDTGSTRPGSDSFSLLFRGPLDTALGQDVYTLSHRRTGSMWVLTTPMRPSETHRFYEVIFNRAVPR